MSKNVGAHGDGIGLRERTFGELHRRRRPQGDDVTLRTGGVEGRTQIANCFDTAVTDLIEMVDWGDDATRAGFRGKNRLRGVEDEQTGHAHAVVGKSAHGADGVFDEWNLNNDLIRKSRELLAVAVRILAIDGMGGDIHWHVDEATDLRELLALVALLLAEKRVRRHHAVEKPICRRPRDVVEVGAREKNLHDSPRYSSRGYATWSRNSA